MNNIISSLFRPVDISSIVFVRIALGLLLSVKVGSYLITGYIDQIWLEPDFHFTYYGFHWVKVLPANYMYTLVTGVSVSALFIALGLFYRISTIVFFLGFSYLFLLDQAVYLNHYYLVIIVSFLIIFIPAHRYFSIDSLIWPKIKRNHISSWCLWILMFQIGLVYFYGGIAKLNLDWLQGWPMWLWIDDSIIDAHANKYLFVYVISYFGLLFDLFIVPLLLYRRTRIYAFILVIVFHMSNKVLFDIGIFPYMSIVLTTIYFSPGWPRKIFRKSLITDNLPDYKPLNPESLNKPQKLLLIMLTVFVVFQVLFPLRHILYPGNVSWTEEGHNFAWHMKLRDKNGSIKYQIRDPKTGNSWDLNPEIYLTERQRRKLATRPYLAIQFAHYIEKQFKDMGYENVEVRTRARVSLNGRKKQLIIDPNTDLTMYSDSLMPAEWILPLTKPLRPIKIEKRPDP